MAKKKNIPTCNARKHDGTICSRRAGSGTDHPGVGPCHYHKGNHIDVKLQVVKGELAMLVGREMQVSPEEGLMTAIRITAAEIMYFEMKIAQLTDSQVTQRLSSQQLDKYGDVHDLKGERKLNLWIRERSKSVDRLARYCKMALDVGIAAKQVQVAERHGEIIATALARIIERLEISDIQRQVLPNIIREELAQIETQNMLRSPLSPGAGQNAYEVMKNRPPHSGQVMEAGVI